MQLKPEPMVLAAVCAAELGGLAGWWPTLTRRILPLPWWGRLAVWLFASSWSFQHFQIGPSLTRRI